MSRNYTTSAEDRVIEQCEAFGGIAAECAEIAQDLDSKLSDAMDKIDALEKQIDKLQNVKPELEFDPEPQTN